jgi:hypothetical protein
MERTGAMTLDVSNGERDKAGLYRMRAAEYRRMAAESNSATTIQGYLDLAAQWDEMARQAEKGVPLSAAKRGSGSGP